MNSMKCVGWGKIKESFFTESAYFKARIVFSLYKSVSCIDSFETLDKLVI